MKISYSALILISVLAGCSTGPGRGRAFGTDPDDSVWEQSRAHPASYGSSDFTVRKDQPIGEKNSNTEFYFKKCEQDGKGTWFSKTSYSCNDR